MAFRNQGSFALRARLEHKGPDEFFIQAPPIAERIGANATRLFSRETDLTRAKLIRDLKDDLGVYDEGVGVILNMLDQIHGLRKVMADFLRSAHEQSAPADDVSLVGEDQGRE
jgi:hypothetical protein